VGPEPLWEFWKGEKCLNPTVGRTPNHPSRGLVTILTSALRLPIFASISPISIRTPSILQTSPRTIVMGSPKSISLQCKPIS
jgi:hypothetical protein